MEKIPRVTVIGLLLLVFGLTFGLKELYMPGDTLDLHARMPENGGWSREVINGRVNVPIRLHLTSDDVVHSFAVAKQDIPAVDIYPGEYSTVDLVFNQPGEYVFYCTRWCGSNHWRMRGKIEIEGQESSPVPTIEQPIFLTHSLDLDSPHEASVLPNKRPAAILPKGIEEGELDWIGSFEEIWLASPETTFNRLLSIDSTVDLNEEQVWNMVAWALSSQGKPGWFKEGLQLYRENCLACHGENGEGNGVIVRGLPQMDYSDLGEEAVKPLDWSEKNILFGASPALLEGKIIRGGMGTGMPNWGTIFTDVEIQALVLYIYSFQMDLEELR